MRLVACLGLCLLLSGCSGLSDMFDSAPDDDAMPAQTVAQEAPAPVPPADDSFCRGVAEDDAMGHGYDLATEARVRQQSLAQCKAIFGR